jgi:hypothetical protein
MFKIKPDFPCYNGKQYLKPIDYIKDNNKHNNRDNKSNGNKDDVQLIRLNGCSSLMGLPLQNNGNYNSHTSELVSSSLANIAHALEAIATILNIKLIHPLKVFESFECLISQNGNQHINIPLTVHLNHSSGYNTVWSIISKIPADGDNNDNRVSYKDNNNTNDNNNNDNNNESFPLALSLMRANVIGLCLQIGIYLSIYLSIYLYIYLCIYHTS